MARGKMVKNYEKNENKNPPFKVTCLRLQMHTILQPQNHLNEDHFKQLKEEDILVIFVHVNLRVSMFICLLIIHIEGLLQSNLASSALNQIHDASI